MTDRERYKRTFNALHASGEIHLEVPMKTWNLKKTAILAACAAILLSAAIPAYAYTSSVFGWGNNLEIVQNGEGEWESWIHTEELTEPVQIEAGRMYFIVNGEHIDITREISEEDAFVYRYTDDLGYEHLWLVGLNSQELENYGYAEFIFQEDRMIGGYSARVNTEPDGTGKPWLDNNKPY